MEEVPRREVQGERQVVAGGGPATELLERLANDVERQVPDHAGVLSGGDELVGCQRAEPRVGPPHERLGTHHKAVDESDLGLQVYVDLAVLEQIGRASCRERVCQYV